MALATAPQVQSDVSTSSTNDPQHPREPRPPRQTRPPVPEPVEGSATPTRRFHQGRPQCRRAIGRLDKLDERPPTPSADLGRPDKLDHRSPSPSRGPQPTTQRDASTSASARTGRAAVATAPLGNRTSRQARRTTPEPTRILDVSTSSTNDPEPTPILDVPTSSTNGPDGRPDGESRADPGAPDRRHGTEVAGLLEPQAPVTAPHARAT